MTKTWIAILAAALFAVAATAQDKPGDAQGPSSSGAQQNPPPAGQTPSGGAQSAPAPALHPEFKDSKEQTSYALGMQMGAGFKKQGIELDPASIGKGFADAYAGGKTILTEDEARAVLTAAQEEFRKKLMAEREEKAQKSLAEGQAFLDANKAKDGVVTLPSGLQYKVMTAGTGNKPSADDTVVCNYRGTFLDGTEFDSSSKHDGPVTFPVKGVIKGWTEALQLMPAGSKWQLFVPPQLGYGERGAGETIPPNATLIFEVELVSIQPKAAEKEAAPADKEENPADGDTKPAGQEAKPNSKPAGTEQNPQ